MWLEAFPGQGGKEYNSHAPECDLLKESLINHYLFKEKFPNIFFDRVSGNSYGIYAAMVANCVLSEEDALEAVKLRADIVRRTERTKSAKDKTSMMSLFGVGRDKVEGIIQKRGLYLTNDYGSLLQVVAGRVEDLENLASQAPRLDIRKTRLLPIEGAYHCPLREEDSEEYAKQIHKWAFADPKVPMISSTEPRLLITAEDIKEELIRQMTRPVELPRVVRIAEENDVEVVFDIGPGNNMQLLVKRLTEKIKVLSFEKDLDMLESQLQP